MNKSQIMKRAWALRKGSGRVFADCLRQAWAEAKGGDMIQLQGSEKQIKWAEQIREKAISEINAIMEKPEYPEWASTSEINEFIAIIQSAKMETRAKWWIDRSNKISIYIPIDEPKMREFKTQAAYSAAMEKYRLLGNIAAVLREKYRINKITN